MQGGTFGSFCFLAFLLSVGETQNVEDLRTGLREDEIESNAEGYTLNSQELDDSDERANFGSLYGYDKNIYTNYPYGFNIPAQSGPYSPFDYSQGYGFGSSYGEASGFSQVQPLDSTFGLNYASAEADANAQALADLSLYGTPYKSGSYGAGSSFAQAQSEAQGNAFSLGMSNFGPYTINPGSSLNFVQNGHTLGSGLVSNYASSDAVAQAVASGSGGYENYNQDLSSAQAQAQANSQSQAFSPGFSSSFTSAEIDSHPLATGFNAFSPESNSLGMGNYGSGLSSAEVNSLLSTSSFGSGSNFAGNSGIQAQIPGDFNIFNLNQGSSGENAIKFPNPFVGANSRLIPPEEYIMPNIIPGGENIKICTKEGEFHNLRSIGYECLICACVPQYGYLSLICVNCDVCSAPLPFPPFPIPIPPVASPVPSDLPSLIPPPTPPRIPSPTPPIPPQEPQVSCDPLPTNTPFQNPLNPCQICICQYSFGFKNDVSISCEENPSCVLSSDLITIPNVSEPHVPESLPLCEKFPTNVEFPHPVDVCKSCKCLVSYNDLTPQHKIVCYPKPDCEPPIPLPSTVPLPMPPKSTDLLPWPPLPKPLPPGPLPGPSPHKSCEPYPPNQPFQHPWDDCQICVCNEIYSIGIVNIEVNCFTNPACCASGYQSSLPQVIREPFPVPMKEPVAVPVGVVVDRPVPVPQLIPVPKPVPVPQPVPQPYPVLSKPIVVSKPVPQPYPVPVREQVPVLVPQPVPHAVPVPHPVPVPVSQPVSLVIQPTKYLDISCKAREVGEEFMYNSCRFCTCQAFGNLVVPICRHANRPECVIMPAAVPLGSVVYIEPRCRYRKPLEPFKSECQSCKCQSIFTYVIAQCSPIPGCGQQYYGGSATLAEAGATANSQLASSSFGHSYGFGNSQSAAASSSASSGSSSYGGYPFISGFSGSTFGAESSANAQSGSSLYNLSPYSNSYPYSQAQGNELESLTGFYTGIYPKPYGQIISVHQPGELLGQSQSLSEAIAQSSASTQGLSQASGLFGGRPFIKSGDVETDTLEEIR